MNSLSWLLLWADWASELQLVVGLTAFAGSFALGVAILVVYIEELEVNFHKKTIIGLYVAAAFILIAAPSKTTFYKIAASEMGEDALEGEGPELVRQLVLQYLSEESPQ